MNWVIIISVSELCVPGKQWKDTWYRPRQQASKWCSS